MPAPGYKTDLLFQFPDFAKSSLAWQPPTQLFSCARNCSFCSFHLRTRRARLTKNSYHLSVLCAPGWIFSHIPSVECTAQLYGMQLSDLDAIDIQYRSTSTTNWDQQ